MMDQIVLAVLMVGILALGIEPIVKFRKTGIGNPNWLFTFAFACFSFSAIFGMGIWYNYKKGIETQGMRTSTYVLTMEDGHKLKGSFPKVPTLPPSNDITMIGRNVYFTHLILSDSTGRHYLVSRGESFEMRGYIPAKRKIRSISFWNEGGYERDVQIKS